MSDAAEIYVRLRLARNDPDLKEVTVLLEDCGDIAKALEGNTHVRSLYVDMGGEEMESRDGLDTEWKAFCQAVQRLPSLEGLLVEFFHPDDEDCTMMGALLQHTRKIKELKVSVVHGDLGVCPLAFARELAAGITGHPTLERILLDDLHSIPAESLAFFMLSFSSIPNLKSLDLNAYWCEYAEYNRDERMELASPRCIKQLIGLPSLEEVTLRNFGFGDEYSAAMHEVLSSPKSSTLRRLRFVNCRMTSRCLELFMEGVANHLNLKHLELRDLRISNYHTGNAEHLLDPLSRSTSLKSLFLTFELEEDEQWPRFDFLRENSALEELKIFFPDNTPELHSENFVSLLEALCTNTSLTILNISGAGGNGLGDDMVDTLVEMIHANVGIKQMNIFGHTIATPKLLELLPALARNTTLEVFNVAPKSMDGTKSIVGTNMATFVKGVLSVSRGLKELRVGYCDAEGLEEILLLMVQNYRFEKLEFRQSYDIDGSSEREALAATIGVIGTLNKFGRRYLKERGPECKVAGVNLLSAVSDDLDCLFYHLRENPRLCDCELDGAAKGRSTVMWRDWSFGRSAAAKKRRLD